MPKYVKVQGTWKAVNESADCGRIKVNGVWRTVTNSYVKVANVWKSVCAPVVTTTTVAPTTTTTTPVPTTGTTPSTTVGTTGGTPPPGTTGTTLATTGTTPTTGTTLGTTGTTPAPLPTISSFSAQCENPDVGGCVDSSTQEAIWTIFSYSNAQSYQVTASPSTSNGSVYPSNANTDTDRYLGLGTRGTTYTLTLTVYSLDNQLGTSASSTITYTVPTLGTTPTTGTTGTTTAGTTYWYTGCCSGTQVTGTSTADFGTALTNMTNQCGVTVTNQQSGVYSGTSNVPTITCPTAAPTTATTAVPTRARSSFCTNGVCQTFVSNSGSDNCAANQSFVNANFDNVTNYSCTVGTSTPACPTCTTPAPTTTTAAPTYCRNEVRSIGSGTCPSSQATYNVCYANSNFTGEVSATFVSCIGLTTATTAAPTAAPTTTTTATPSIPRSSFCSNGSCFTYSGQTSCGTNQSFVNANYDNVTNFTCSVGTSAPACPSCGTTSAPSTTAASTTAASTTAASTTAASTTAASTTAAATTAATTSAGEPGRRCTSFDASIGCCTPSGACGPCGNGLACTGTTASCDYFAC